jgi:hypothetical protein
MVAMTALSTSHSVDEDRLTSRLGPSSLNHLLLGARTISELDMSLRLRADTELTLTVSAL